MTKDVPMVYADTVQGARTHPTGLVYCALGIDGFETDEKETVVRLVLPHPAADRLASVLIEACRLIGGSPVKERFDALDEEQARLRRSELTARLVSMATEGFAVRVARRLVQGGPLADVLRECRTETLRDLKNVSTTGVAIEDEAEAFREAIGQVEQALDRVTTKIRHVDD